MINLDILGKLNKHLGTIVTTKEKIENPPYITNKKKYKDKLYVSYIYEGENKILAIDLYIAKIGIIKLSDEEIEETIYKHERG